MNATCKLHGSPKNKSTAISPLHRLQNLDLMDDVPLTYSKENQTNASSLTTPIIEHNKIMTPRRQANHHQLYAVSNDLSTNTTNHKNKSLCGTISGSGGINVVSASTVCDGGGGVGGGSCSSGAGIAFGTTTATAASTAATSQQHYDQQQHHHRQSHHQHSSHSNKLDDGCGLRHRWQVCPELHKAMDGVNYIADHTKKEEESTKVGASHTRMLAYKPTFQPFIDSTEDFLIAEIVHISIRTSSVVRHMNNSCWCLDK